MTGFRATALHHFGLSVADLEDTVRWYRDKLGFAEEFRYEIAAFDARVAFMALNGLRIEIFQREGAAPMPERSRHPATDLRNAGLKHVAIGVEDIEHAVAALTARGVAFSARSRPSRIRAARATCSSRTTTESRLNSIKPRHDRIVTPGRPPRTPRPHRPATEPR